MKQSMIYGYTRVSKEEQNLDLQLDRLQAAGCEKIFQEKISGAAKAKPEFERMLEQLRKGDIVVVWRIDRLGRTTLELIKLMVEFREKGVEFKSLTEGIDTTTSMGRVWFMLSAIFAENEREVLKERTMAGLNAARARGRTGGRKEGLSPKAKESIPEAVKLYRSELSVRQIAKLLDVSLATLYKMLKAGGVEVGAREVGAKKKQENEA